jgi:hypothetical protein
MDFGRLHLSPIFRAFLETKETGTSESLLPPARKFHTWKPSKEGKLVMTQLKTFLPQNQFYSDVYVPTTSGSAAVTLSPPLSAAADALSVSVAQPAGAIATETAAIESVRTVAADILSDNFIGHLIHHARLAGAFIPDFEAMEVAMQNPNAPRALEGDPVWEDDAPLFLRDIA